MIPSPDFKVLHTVASTRADHGGPSRSVPLLCEALAGQDLSVRLVTAVPATASGDEAAILPDEPVDTRVVRERGWLSRKLRTPLGFYQALRADVESDPPALLHDHGVWLPSNAAAALVARQQHVPLLVSTRGMLTAWALRHHRWKKRLAWWAYQRWVLRQAALFHVTSQEEVDALRGLGFDQPAAVIPNGVPLPDLSGPEAPEGGERRALFLSRLHPKKGLPMLLEAWAEVAPEGWLLDLVGPSEDGHRAELEAQARRLELDDQVRFIGPVSDDEKWDVYRRADLFVLPTYSENFGIVVAEALAAGVPVITTTGAPWSDLEARDCGWWVDPNEEAIADALGMALTLEPDQRKAMGRRGRRLVEERYSWEGVAAQMREAYQWVLKGGTPPDCVRHG
jgi:glycosyltransferase involved in cell wall biosynthesis